MSDDLIAPNTVVFAKGLSWDHIDLFNRDTAVQEWMSQINRNFVVERPFEVTAINGNLKNDTLYSAQFWVRNAYAKLTDAYGNTVLENGKQKLAAKPEERLVEYRRNFAAVAYELVCKKEDGTEESSWLMVQQYRMTGKPLEIPAGMIAQGSVQLNALRELQEETSLKLEAGHLFYVGSATVSSPWCNEIGHLYYGRAATLPKTLEWWDGKSFGEMNSGEVTVVRLIPEADRNLVSLDCMKNAAAFLRADEVRALIRDDFSQCLAELDFRKNEKGIIVPYKPSEEKRLAVANKLKIGAWPANLAV